MYSIKRPLLCTVLGISLFLSSCGVSGGCKRIKLPARPQLELVEVSNKSVKGKELEDVIENHLKTWKYIHELESLGCFEKRQDI